MPKVNLQGEMVEGEGVEFSPLKESWDEYQLADGYKLRTRLVVSKVTRVKGRTTPEGDPIYVVNSQTVVSILAPTNKGDIH